jgi:hypothetical protein
MIHTVSNITRLDQNSKILNAKLASLLRFVDDQFND